MREICERKLTFPIIRPCLQKVMISYELPKGLSLLCPRPLFSQLTLHQGESLSLPLSSPAISSSASSDIL